MNVVKDYQIKQASKIYAKSLELERELKALLISLEKHEGSQQHVLSLNYMVNFNAIMYNSILDIEKELDKE